MNIFIAIFTIGALVILHELGHFFAAKKFNVKVEEFGMGLPPRLFGKRKGETLYSVNALPIGGFVRMEGEEKRSDDPRSFNRKPIWQRFTIVAAGVVVFWLIAVAIFTVLGATAGIPVSITDDNETRLENPHIRVIGVANNSPAQEAGLRLGDIIASIEGQPVSKVGEVQRLVGEYAGQETALVLHRGKEIIETSLIPRENPPQQQGPIGINPTRSGTLKYPWYEAPIQGVVRTWNVTLAVFQGFWFLISQLAAGEELPPGAQVSGPIGVVVLLKDIFTLGPSWFLSFVATISIYLAIFNTIPIPALDGGRMFFLLLEGIRKKPLPEKLEQRLVLISFLVLTPLILFVSVNDLRNLF